MSAPPTPSAAETPERDAAPASEAALRAVLERQLAVLGRLADAGLNIALAIEARATGAEPAEADAAPAAKGQGDVALAYARVSRAVRLTIALQGRVVEALQELDLEGRRRESRAQAEADRLQREARAQRKARVERIVERLIQAEAASEADSERLADEAYERLEGDDIYGDLLDRPVAEVIAQICQDLGLSPDWTQLAQEAWAQEALAEREALETPPTRVRWLDPPLDPAIHEPRCASP